MESQKTRLERTSGGHPGESWELPRKEIHSLFGQPVSMLNCSHHGRIAPLHITDISLVAGKLRCCHSENSDAFPHKRFQETIGT